MNLKKLVLIVDDEPNILDYLGQVLNKAGYEVEKCGTPATALERLQVEDFDLVISDIRMPGMSGLDMIRLARGQGKAIESLIFLSGNAVDDQLVQDVQSLRAVLVSKPIMVRKLLETIAQIFEGTSPAAP